MGIKGSVLHDNVLGNTDTERGEVPYGLDTALYHGIRYLLGYFDRYRQHAYIDIVLLHLLLELVRVIDGDAAQCRTHQFGLHIESSHYLPNRNGLGPSRAARHLPSFRHRTERLCVYW